MSPKMSSMPVVGMRTLSAIPVAVMLLLPSTGSAEHPLEPAVTSSPRETLATFLEESDALWSIVRAEGTSERSEDGLRLSREHDIRSIRTFDMSEIAPKARVETAHAVQVYLYEVLSRIELPTLEDVPDDEFIAENPGLSLYTIPHTEIHIRKVEEGPRRGEFLFAPETIERAEEFYERTRDLPYLRPPPIENVGTFLQVYGGWDIAISTVDALPAWMRTVVGEQAIWKWFVFALFIAANIAVLVFAYRLTRRGDRPRSVWIYVRRLLVPALLFVSATVLVPSLILAVNITGDLANYMQLTASAIAHIALAWASITIALALGEAISRGSKRRAESLDASIIRLTSQLVGIGTATAIIFRGASQIGLPLVGLVASISIGGLAIALAAQDTLKSLLGSLMILVDQPYKVGERIVAAGHDGVVERIGLRSTRIRQLDGNLTSIPNEQMATMEVENVGRRESIRRKSEIRIAIGTPREKVEQALSIVRDVLSGHEGMSTDKPPRVYFAELNPDSLGIVFYYWFHPADFWGFCELSERVNLEIIRRLGEAGIPLVPPTRRTEIADERTLPGEPSPI